MHRVLFRYKQAERETLLNTLRRLLEEKPEIVFAYVHGSFLKDRPFHDVDLAVYLDPGEINGRDMTWFVLKLALDLEKSLLHLSKDATRPHPPLDVRALNRAPLGFRYRVCRGKLLVNRDQALRAQWVERTVCSYLDLRPLQHRALKEAMTA